MNDGQGDVATSPAGVVFQHDHPSKVLGQYFLSVKIYIIEGVTSLSALTQS